MNRIMVLLAMVSVTQPLGAYKVRVDFDHHGNFSQYQTYRWVQPEVTTPPGSLFPNELMRERIIVFIDQALAARHLKRVESGGDLLVTYGVDVTEQEQYTTFTNGFGCCWDGSSISTTIPQTILTGRLVVNMTDARKQQLVYQGVSTHTISSRPERNTKRLARAVNEIFGKYPPR